MTQTRRRFPESFKREAVDSLSAQLILESWMRSRPES